MLNTQPGAEEFMFRVLDINSAACSLILFLTIFLCEIDTNVLNTKLKSCTYIEEANSI